MLHVETGVMPFRRDLAQFPECEFRVVGCKLGKADRTQGGYGVMVAPLISLLE